MVSSRYDEALIQILHAEGKIMPFLDVIFGFLHRRTDFYHEHARPSAVGFPPGVAEQLVVTTFRKWREIHRSSAVAPPAAVAEEVVTSPTAAEAAAASAAAGKMAAAPAAAEAAAAPAAAGKMAAAPSADESEPAAQSSRSKQPPQNGDGNAVNAQRGDGSSGGRAAGNSADSHNGAVRDGYSWSQTITDLTVRVPVPPDIRRARQVSVQLRSDRVAVQLAGGGVLMSGRLHRAIQAQESTWSLLPADCVQLSLEKGKECWWTSLLEEEPDIDLRQIEAVKPWEDLSEEEQMKVNELKAREEAKRRPAAQAASVATSGGKSKDVTALLREAWDAEGSPFKGQPYDPAAVQIVPGAADSTS